MKIRAALIFTILVWTCLAAAGCSHTYPEQKLKDSLKEICRKEYGVDKIEVQVAGETIAVYLPLEKLFTTDDFKSAILSGKIRNLGNLFEPSPEALEKMEDVLFSLSRVILSTDKPLKFYILEATDVGKTGLAIILTGYVEDIKRLRLMDISREEYRKRVLHEIKLNRAVLWHRPVRQFFSDLELMDGEKVQEKYFGSGDESPETATKLLKTILGLPDLEPHAAWEILDIRSALIKSREILVYAKARPQNWAGLPGEDIRALEYLFVVAEMDSKGDLRIIRIIPFQYLDASGKFKKMPLPQDLQQGFEKSLDQWEEEFPAQEIHLGPFLAQQLTRRAQLLVAKDERIQNTFREVNLTFNYHEDTGEPYFSLDLEVLLRDITTAKMKDSIVWHEDMLYLLTLASREFVTVLRGYQFKTYSYLTFNVAQDTGHWTLGREDLELFRQKKVDLAKLLAVATV